MERPSRAGVDFDVWVRLAREDPERFEALRRRVLEHAISRAPVQRQARLRGLQWRIDRARELAPNPMAACVSISKMMWESLTGRDGLLGALRTGAKHRQSRAAVVPMPRRH